MLMWGCSWGQLLDMTLSECNQADALLTFLDSSCSRATVSQNNDSREPVTVQR
jgi:hypothetical protein